MDPGGPSGPGPIEIVRRMLDSCLALAQARLHIFALDLQQEKLRLLKLLFAFWLGLALTAAGMMVAAAALAYLAWQVGGALGLALLPLLFFGGALAVFAGLRRRLKTNPIPFADTIAEFEKDRACLKGQD